MTEVKRYVARATGLGGMMPVNERYVGADKQYVLARDYDALQQQVEALRGLVPEMPGFPPEGAGLPRYGLRWNGPSQPLSVPMEDGYWTPWHLANQGETLAAANLMQSLAGLIEGVRSINCRPQHVVKINGDDEPCFWQRREWVEYVLGLCTEAEKVLSKHRQLQGESPNVRP